MATTQRPPADVKGAPAKKKAGPPGPKTSHDVYVTIIFELIGISLLAILADLNDELGKLLVIMMAGWFLFFLITNAGWLAAHIPGASTTVPGLKAPIPQVTGLV